MLVWVLLGLLLLCQPVSSPAGTGDRALRGTRGYHLSVREVAVRMVLVLGFTATATAHYCGVHRDTVRSYVARFATRGTVVSAYEEGAGLNGTNRTVTACAAAPII